jgi:GTP cyclohydrolase II
MRYATGQTEPEAALSTTLGAQPDPSALQGDATCVAVERAIAEIRAGRPVVIVDDGRSLALGVEALDAGRAAEFATLATGSARLVLPGPRLRRLGGGDAPAAIALPQVDPVRVRALALETAARLDAAPLPPVARDLAALELMRLALVAPAALVADLAAGAAPGALVVAGEDIMAFRARRLANLRIVGRAPVPLEGAPDSEFVVFRGGEGLRDQVAILIGAPDLTQPVWVRLHSACLTGDLFGSLKCDCGDQLRGTARWMAENGGGVLLYLDQEGRGNGLSNKIRAYGLQAQGFDTYDADEVLGFDHDQRRFDFAAAMLGALGVRRVRLMTNNPVKIAALREAGLDIVSDARVMGRRNDHNQGYLAAKRDRAGHLFEADVDPAAEI